VTRLPVIVGFGGINPAGRSSNALALKRFIDVAKKVRANLNDKYDIGFIDPGVEGDWQ
jgi:hypothetical protein